MGIGHPEAVDHFLDVPRLTKTHSPLLTVSGDVHTQNDPRLTQVLHLEPGTQLPLCVIKERFVTARDQQVVDVQCDDKNVPPFTPHIHAIIFWIALHPQRG